MRYLILVICSFLIFVSCSFWSNIKKKTKIPINISKFYEDLVKSSQHPFWGGPIKVVESGTLVSFQLTGSKDFIIVDKKSGNFKKLYPNPPDSIGGMVYRYNPVSFVFANSSGFSYLKNENQLIHIEELGDLENPVLLKGEVLSNPSKILYISNKSMISFWYGSSLKGNSSKGGLFFTDLERNSTNRIISDDEFESIADLVVEDNKIIILEKYRPVIRVFDFTGKELQTIDLPKSNYLKYQKLVRPTGFQNLTSEEKVTFLEDYCLDLTQKGDTTAYLHQIKSTKNNSLVDRYLLTLFSKGTLQEKLLEFTPLNFSSNGDVYLINKTDSGQFLIQKTLNQIF